MENIPEPAAPSRSKKVSAIAWLFIALALISTYNGARQLFAHTALSLFAWQPALYVVFSLAVLAAAAGTLLRSDLARKALVALLALAALMNVAILAYVKIVFALVLPLRVKGVVAAATALLGGCAYLLARRETAAEFRRPPAP
jgi:hypothetical protein